jgi:23S rRNA pseudouridine2605 synthase
VKVIRVTTSDRNSGFAVLRVVIREGRRRQVRRMLHAVGHKVKALKRTAFGPLTLGHLKAGEWRELGEGELAALRRATEQIKK